MEHVPDSLKKVRNELFNAVLQSDIEKILKALSDGIIYQNTQNTNANIIKGKQALKKELVTLFEDNKVALSLTKNKITLADTKALEWSNFTLFIDHLLREESISLKGHYSAVWEQAENEEWVIIRIMENASN